MGIKKKQYYLTCLASWSGAGVGVRGEWRWVTSSVVRVKAEGSSEEVVLLTAAEEAGVSWRPTAAVVWSCILLKHSW